MNYICFYNVKISLTKHNGNASMMRQINLNIALLFGNENSRMCASYCMWNKS